MFTRIDHFRANWAYESEHTLKLLRALTDGSLAQAVTPGRRTLGRIAWHLVLTMPEMLGHAGLTIEGPAQDAPVPGRAADIANAYERTAASLAAVVTTTWDDEALRLEDEMYGERWRRGFTLLALVSHQAHHRGQLTVLMRQAGLAVPGVYGPAEEEWAGMGAPPPSV
jgi:uncharacterized damage-inducible protein DinB